MVGSRHAFKKITLTEIRNIIISPSGNFYGSEQVLFDYLKSTNLQFRIYAPENSQLMMKVVNTVKGHIVEGFGKRGIVLLYLRVLSRLIFTKVNFVYLNEAGHLRYLAVLSRVMFNKRFFVHVRLLEDTDYSRWPLKRRNNFYVFAVSQFIQFKLKYPSIVIYDGYYFQNMEWDKRKGWVNPFKIGIIGRLTKSKGMDHLIPLLTLMINNSETTLKVILFGDEDKHLKNTEYYNEFRRFENLEWRGFVENKSSIYNQIDCVLHLAHLEPLGRIYFESLDFGVPFIGFNSGGIGELASRINYTTLLVEPDTRDLYQHLLDKILYVKNNYDSVVQELLLKRETAKLIFGIKEYAQTLDAHLTG